MSEIDNLRYPIGRPRLPDGPATAAQREEWIADLERLPERLRAAVRELTPEEWETPYRPEGWTVRQVVHHLADSHLNACTRFRLALTEAHPTIRPYDEAAWAELTDAREAPPELSLALLEALHARLVLLLRSLPEAEFRRTLYHPEQERSLSLDQLLALYAWHSCHHLAHITGLRERMAEPPPTLLA